MHPLLAGVVPAYLLIVMWGLATAILAGGYSLRRIGVGTRECLRIQGALVLAGLSGGMLFSVVGRGGAPPASPELAHSLQPLAALVAVAVLLPIARRLWCQRLTLGTLADVLAPSVAVGTTVAHVGCLAYGCCFGTPTAMPWGVQFPFQSPAWNAHVTMGLLSPRADMSLPVHPLPLYFIVFSLGAGGMAWWLQRSKSYPGEVALAFLATDGLGKWALESLRHEPLTVVRLASLLLAMSAVTLLLLLPALPRAGRATSGARRLERVTHRSRPRRGSA